MLHVLPHAGEGAETYLDVLGAMEGWSQARRTLTEHREAARAAKAVARGYPGLVGEVRGHDLVQVHGEMAALLALPALRLRPSVFTPHGLHLLRRTTGTARRAALAALWAMVATTDRTICVSHSEHAELAAAVGPRLARRAVAVPNGIDPPPPPTGEERRRAREELGLDQGELVALYAAQLEPRKDPLTAAQAARRARRRGAAVTLLMAGDGPLRSQVDALASPSLRVLGRRADMRRLLAASDAFLLPSRREGLSYALLEAMAAGLAPLVADGPGNAEVVGSTGVVAPVGDADALAGALGELAADRERGRRMGEGARARVQSEYPAGPMIERTREVYGAALAARLG